MSFQKIIDIFSNAKSIFNLSLEDRKRLEKINFKNFITDIVKIDNPYIFDLIMKYLEYKEDVSEYFELRKEFIEKKILNNSYLDKWLDEYIITYFYEDNYYNFVINLLQMVSFQKSYKKDLVKLDNIELYNKFSNIAMLSKEDKIKLFKENKNINLKEMFYDDMRIVKDSAYKEMVDKSLKLDKNNNIYNNDLSSRYHVDVYYLNGEEFYTFIRTFKIRNDDLKGNMDYLNSNLDRFSYSFSYISDKNIGTMDYTRKSITLMYDSINPNNISYVHHSDLHSGKKIKQDSFITNKINEIKTPEDLINRTSDYNEIVINGNMIIPKALICYDDITDTDITFAKEHNLVILLINTSKYKTRDAEYEDFFDNTYSL